jgi:phosphoserine phosphatase RsbU/P
MRILLAEDHDASRSALRAWLTTRGHEIVAVGDGAEAWKILSADDPPRMAIVGWSMPHLDGIELCRRVRATSDLKAVYLILVSSQNHKQHLLQGLWAGANACLGKPLDPDELEAQIHVGGHVVQLHSDLAARLTELQDAFAKVKQLQGLLPMCTYCKSIRDDQEYWHRVEQYIGAHTKAQFSHGICPECWKNVVEPQLEASGLLSQMKASM